MVVVMYGPAKMSPNYQQTIPCAVVPAVTTMGIHLQNGRLLTSEIVARRVRASGKRVVELLTTRRVYITAERLRKNRAVKFEKRPGGDGVAVMTGFADQSKS
ncbi:hypothetical protein H6P81_008811 [Aristolochia fimbriata]|uniref:Uncharacterized protein n=1 Tax=Aristolochia fimbriata TaxID=158543 RepID=A0AAV7EME7_ARIFI|nr:hypothetical protein H6P81_008811 [Aristolochia fimbriata]